MLSLLDCSPEELRTLADFGADPWGTAVRLAEMGIVPVIQADMRDDLAGKTPRDVLIGFERTECGHSLARD